tara:strand:- start:3599 stop:4762 length:1164 start_codon:yes stop_codon:yes gene_type:complete
MTLLDDSKIITTANAAKAGVLYSVKPESGLADLDVTRSTTATIVNESGLIESVAVNEPQLDYTDGSCPCFLVEPQRTNINIYSNDYITNRSSSNTIVTANAATSPDGTNNATKFEVSSGGYMLTWNTFYSVSAGDYTCSFYAKNINATEMKVGIFSGNTFANIVAPFSYISQVNTSTWTRVSFTFTVASGTTLIGVEQVGGGSLGDFLLFGSQVEIGSYATSYIPTAAASVTRNATTFVKSGLSSLIGQTDGVLFLETQFLEAPTVPKFIGIGQWGFDHVSIGGYNNGNWSVFFYLSGSHIVLQTSLGAIDSNFHKIAFKYGSGDSAVWLDGVEIYTSTATGTPSATDMDVLGGKLGNVLYTFDGKIKQMQVYDAKLTDSELLTLTT